MAYIHYQPPSSYAVYRFAPCGPIHEDTFHTLEGAEALRDELNKKFPGWELGDGRRVHPETWDRWCEEAHNYNLAHSWGGVKMVADREGVNLRTLERRLRKWRTKNGIPVTCKNRPEHKK